jgi:hypothetical protein
LTSALEVEELQYHHDTPMFSRYRGINCVSLEAEGSEPGRAIRVDMTEAKLKVPNKYYASAPKTYEYEFMKSLEELLIDFQPVAYLKTVCVSQKPQRPF